MARRGLQEELGLTTVRDLKPVVQFRMDYGPNDNMACELWQAAIDDYRQGTIRRKLPRSPRARWPLRSGSPRMSGRMSLSMAVYICKMPMATRPAIRA